MGATFPLPRIARRVCLKCDKKFRSKGPGNRICGECSRINARYANMPDALLQMERGEKRHNGEVMECS